MIRPGSAAHFAQAPSAVRDPYDVIPPSAPRRRRRRTGLVVALVVVGMVVALLAVAGALGLRLYHSYERIQAQATQAMSAAGGLGSTLSSGDTGALPGVAQTVSSSAHTIRDELSDVSWSLAAHLPVYGGDVSNVRTLADVLVDLSDNALTPAADAVGGMSLSQLMVGGAVNVPMVKQLVGVVQTVEPVIDRSSGTLAGLPASKIQKVDDVVGKLSDALGKANDLLGKVDGVLPCLPAVLGADGQTRTYLVVAQNNAEIRATGGFPGAWGTLTVTDGTVSMGDFTTLAGRRDVEFSITDEERAAFGDGMAVSPGNFNYTPDFSRAGSLFAQAWQAYEGVQVDGVIALDPVFLQWLLGITGGITTDDGVVIDGGNAAKVLLNDAYWRFPNGDDSDAFFAYVAGLAADRVMGGLGSASASQLFDVLNRAADKGRLIVWMANPDEEQAMQNLGLAGTLSADPVNPVLGVYVNDNTWAKLAWYLDLKTTVGAPATNADGSVTYDVTTTLTNTITPEEAQEAPSYITGISPAKRSVDDLFVNPLLVAPAGGTLSDVTVQGVGSMRMGTLYGYAIAVGDVNVASGETATITYKVTVPAGAVSSLAVRQTPTGQTFEG